MKRYLLYLGLAVAVGLTSCSKDRGLGDDGGSEWEIPSGHGAVQFAFKTPPAPKATTLPGTAAENAVDNIYIYVFKNGRLETTQPNIKAAELETGTGSELTGYSYKTLNLKGAGIRHLYVIANADKQKLEDQDIRIGYLETDFQALKTAAITDTKAIATPLLMTAVSGDFEVVEGIMNTCKLDLKRAVARFDIKVAEMAGAKAEPFFEITGARIINARTQISLLPQDAHQIAPTTIPVLADLESVVNTDPAIADRGGKQISMTGQLYAYENLFMVDDTGKQVPTAWELDNATTVEVSGNRLKWKDGAVEQTTAAAYVVKFLNLIDDDKDGKIDRKIPVQIDRNNRYTITLQPGAESDIDNNVTIDQWEDGDVVIDKEVDGGLADIKASDIAPVVNTNIPNVTYDNTKVEEPKFTITGPRGTIIDLYIESSAQPTLQYDANDGLVVTDFVRVTPGGAKTKALTKAGDDKHPTIGGKDKMLFMARVNILSNAVTDAGGSTFQILTPKGKLGKEYTVIKTDKLNVVDPANTFMVVPGEKVDFEATVMGNGNTTAEPLATETVEILWQDAQNLVTTADVTFVKADGIATVQTKAGTSGNAVVVAKNAGGEIVWSWHVWVSDYQPVKQSSVAANTAYAVTGGEVHTYGTEYLKVNPGKVIMDRNLGATIGTLTPPATSVNNVKNFGFFYQWGRKDPFPGWDGVDANAKASVTLYGADGTTDVTTTAYQNVAGPVSLETAIANPGNFYYANDWTTPQNDVLWSDGAQKSVYDPCPKGWRIAPNGTWSDFTPGAADGTFPYYSNGTIAEGTTTYLNSNGRYYNQGSVKVWYPAPGYRERANGALTHVGGSGYSWSSSVIGFNALRLNFGSSGVTPSHAYYRAFGYQARCVQE